MISGNGKQDKRAEIITSSTVPPREWLENSTRYRIKKAHLELLQLLPSQDRLILDAGCGQGAYGIILAQEGNKVVGVDISSGFVSIAREIADQKEIGFSPVVGDLESLPYKDSTFDICFCGWALHHFPNLHPVIKELARVLKPGGTMALVEPNESNLAMRFSRFVEDLLSRWVLKAGLDTPNRTKHSHRDYSEALTQCQFADVRVGSCYVGAPPPLAFATHNGGSKVMRTLVRLRGALFSIAGKLLPRPLNGADLLITGWSTRHTKQDLES